MNNNTSNAVLRHANHDSTTLQIAKPCPPVSGAKTVIKNLRILHPDFANKSSGGTPPLFNGTIEIVGKSIEMVHESGSTSEIHALSGAAVIDGSGFIALPGLINVHTHAAMGFFRGLGHGKTNMIESFLFPAEKALTKELLEPLSWSYLVSCLRAGITTIGEHYYMVDGVGAALERLGMRGFIGETIADLGGAFPGRDSWSRARAAIESWNHGELVRPVVAPHAADTVSRELLKEAAKYARANRLPLHLHLSQTTGELERVRALDKMTPVEKASACDALWEQTIAVHLISANENDFSILRESDATAVLCPASQIIYEKIAPLASFAKHGLNFAIATDCAASNDGSDLFTECKLTGLLAKDRNITGAYFEPDALMKSITTNPARALGMAERIGVLAPGAYADIAFIRDDLSIKPAFDDLRNLIYSGHQGLVEHVMINGEWVLWGRELCKVNEQTLTKEFNDAVVEIMKRTGLKQ